MPKSFSHALPRVQSFMRYNDFNSEEAFILIFEGEIRMFVSLNHQNFSDVGNLLQYFR